MVSIIHNSLNRVRDEFHEMYVKNKLEAMLRYFIHDDNKGRMSTLLTSNHKFIQPTLMVDRSHPGLKI